MKNSANAMPAHINAKAMNATPPEPFLAPPPASTSCCAPAGAAATIDGGDGQERGGERASRHGGPPHEPTGSGVRSSVRGAAVISAAAFFAFSAARSSFSRQCRASSPSANRITELRSATNGGNRNDP